MTEPTISFPGGTKAVEGIRTTPGVLARTTAPLLWVAFLATAGYTAAVFPDWPQYNWKGLLRIDGFTLLIWMTVTFFGAVVSRYGRNYLAGFRHQERFMALTLGFVGSVMLLPAAEHLALILLCWLAMGLIMSRLIGIDSGWTEAREAGRNSRRYFLSGTLLLALGAGVPAFWARAFTLQELLGALDRLPAGLVLFSAICIAAAAVIQSAIYPFHRWLLSSMTAPTPASALMHAGFVNGAGILLTLFAPLLFASDTLTLLLVIGGLTAIVSQFAKLLQVHVKHKLACSTIAQMGFMVMQCGLGFFNAAVAHLILHGFYKAYLFLSAGEGIAPTQPQASPYIRIKPLQALVVLAYGVLGAYLFMALTGKGKSWDSGIFLTLIAAITVGQVTYNFVKQNSFALWQRLLLPPVLFTAGIGLYALTFNGVTALMAQLPQVAEPQPLTAVQIGFGLVFLAGFFVMKLGIYRRFPWLYVKLMNLTQPYKQTILAANTPAR